MCDPETPEPRDVSENRTENAEDGEMSVRRVMKKKLERTRSFKRPKDPKKLLVNF